jgi:hypothetical protein
MQNCKFVNFALMFVGAALVGRSIEALLHFACQAACLEI